MPHSSDEGKMWMLSHIIDRMPCSVLDIGPGDGRYGVMAKSISGAGPVRCIEIFEPYVETYGLKRIYDEVIVADARSTAFPKSDVVIFGDVLEHMTLTEARFVWREAARAARKAVLLSIPIVPYPQGPSEGNVYETHVTTWDHETVMRELAGITDFETYSEIGVYERAIR